MSAEGEVAHRASPCLERVKRLGRRAGSTNMSTPPIQRRDDSKGVHAPAVGGGYARGRDAGTGAWKLVKI